MTNVHIIFELYKYLSRNNYLLTRNINYNKNMAGRKSKLNKNTMFYSDKDADFEIQIGEDYVKQDMNQSVMVFQIDRNKTATLDLYGESVDETSISYKDPVEINVVLLLAEAVNKSYDKTQGLARYLLTGNLNFGVYEKTLKENKIDISFGDYIGLQVTPDQMEYFVVTNDGRINFDNKHTMYGTKSYFRSIFCSPCDKNEFNGV